MPDKLVNRVANSALVTLDLEKLFYPSQQIVAFDIKDYLFKGLILKEKDFRSALTELDWSQYDGKVVHVYCSTDAILPTWAFMLISNYLSTHAHEVYFGDLETSLTQHFRAHIDQFDVTPFTDKRVVLKGCSKEHVPPSAYLDMTKKLSPVVRSLMFGEPCSTVPIFKKKSTSRVVQNQ